MTCWWATIPSRGPCGNCTVTAACPRKLRLTLPHTDIAARDPKGLRWYVLIAFAVGVVLARNETGARLIAAFDSGAGSSARIDAWVDPPPYTGHAA